MNVNSMNMTTMMNTKLMCGDMIVADAIYDSATDTYKMVARKGVENDYLPFGLFRAWTTREVTMEEFISWAKERSFPKDRIGAEQLLVKLGLTEYDAWEIVKKTNGYSVGVDHFWIDFGEEKSEEQQPEYEL